MDLAATASLPATAPPQSKVGAVLGATGGNFLEMFDFFLFGLYAQPIGKAFFHTGSEFLDTSIAFVVFWRYLGWNVVLYLSALQVISGDLYEAATLDGASRWQQFRYIALPLLKPMMFFAITLTLIGNLQLFEEPFILTGGTGGIDQAGKTAAMHMYAVAFMDGDFGTASAIAWLLFVLIAATTWLNKRLLGARA